MRVRIAALRSELVFLAVREAAKTRWGGRKEETRRERGRGSGRAVE